MGYNPSITINKYIKKYDVKFLNQTHPCLYDHKEHNYTGNTFFYNLLQIPLKDKAHYLSEFHMKN